MGARYELVTGIPSAGPLVAGGSALARTQDAGIAISPRIVPPVNAIAVNAADSVATVGVNNLVNLPGCSIVLAGNDQGVINTLELMIDGIGIATQVYWRISINGAPVPGWNRVTILGRNGAASIARSFPPPMALGIPTGGRLDVDVLNVDGAAYTVGASLYGWQWSQ